jgi:hypothetical protein
MVELLRLQLVVLKLQGHAHNTTKGVSGLVFFNGILLACGAVVEHRASRMSCMIYVTMKSRFPIFPSPLSIYGIKRMSQP